MNSIIDAQNDYLYCRGVDYADILSGNLPMTPATAMDHKLRIEDRVFKFKSKYSSWSTDQKLDNVLQPIK